MTHYCYFCGKELLGDDDPEHIIPNAVGGKLKSKYILCSEDNNRLSELDNFLSQELGFFTNFLNPVRDRGKNPDLDVKIGEHLVKKTPQNEYFARCVQKSDEKNIQYTFLFTPGTKYEEKAYQNIERIKKEGGKKGNRFTITNECAIPNEIINFQIEFNKTKYLFLSVLKIVVGFCVQSGVPIASLKKQIDILKNKNITEVNKDSNYYEPNSFYPTDSIYHTLYVRADNEQNVFYALVSLFGCCNLFFCLDNNYHGENFEKTYCFDLLNHKESQIELTLLLSKKDILNIIENNKIIGLNVENFNRFMKFLPNKPFKSSEDIMKEKFLNKVENFIKSKTEPLSFDKFKAEFNNEVIKELEKDGSLIVKKRECLEELFMKMYEIYIRNMYNLF